MKSIVNGRILIPDGVIDQKVLTFDQRIAEIASEPPEEAEIIDAKGCYVAPGLIDVHCHGFMGWDTSRADLSDLRNMCAHLVRNGVTSWLPTTLTLPWPELEKCFTAIREVMRESALPEWRGGAQVLGCHAEGPFISPRRKGAQREEYIQRPDPRRIKPWASVIRLITVAPEVDGALDFIRAARRMGIAVSMGHSDATAEQAFAAIEAGVTHVTHTFNAMAPLNHHNPGLVGAALNDDRVYCELIADGLHVSPLMLPLMARLKLHRLVLMPLLVYLVCRLLGVSDIVTGVSTMMAAMPAGATTTMLAAKYDRDPQFATRLVVFTTLCSVPAIFVWSLILM